MTDHESDHDSEHDESEAHADHVNMDLRQQRDAAHTAVDDSADATDGEREAPRSEAIAGGGGGDGGDDGDEFDARAEAKRLIGDAEDDAETRGEAIEAAVDNVESHLQQLGQRLQTLRQQEQEKENRLRDLREAKAHLKRIPDDQWVSRTFGGGVTMAVPPADKYDADDAPDVETASEAEAELVDWSGVYDRDDLLRDIQDTIDEEQTTLATKRDEQQKMERGIERAQRILRELQNAREAYNEWRREQANGGGTGGHGGAGGGGAPGGGGASQFGNGPGGPDW